MTEGKRKYNVPPKWPAHQNVLNLGTHVCCVIEQWRDQTQKYGEKNREFAATVRQCVVADMSQRL
jgi:hypothetical protein